MGARKQGMILQKFRDLVVALIDSGGARGNGMSSNWIHTDRVKRRFQVPDIR